MAYNLREKEYAIDEHARQIQMLKAALRRGSDASYRSAVSATSIKVNEVSVLFFMPYTISAKHFYWRNTSIIKDDQVKH